MQRNYKTRTILLLLILTIIALTACGGEADIVPTVVEPEAPPAELLQETPAAEPSPEPEPEPEPVLTGAELFSTNFLEANFANIFEMSFTQIFGEIQPEAVQWISADAFYPLPEDEGVLVAFDLSGMYDPTTNYPTWILSPISRLFAVESITVSELQEVFGDSFYAFSDINFAMAPWVAMLEYDGWDFRFESADPDSSDLIYVWVSKVW